MRHTEFVLLGEVHNNPDHHRLQAGIIEHMTARGRKPAVVFEIFDREDQAVIDRLRSDGPIDLERLAEATGVAREGWPWDLYRPLMRAVLSADLPLIAADLPGAELRAIVRSGLTALGAARIAAWGLTQPLPNRYTQRLRGMIVEAHCGHAEQLIDGMIAAQRARDAALAAALANGAGAEGAVLIAGAAHVRRDWAVPFYLERLAPGRSSLSLAFIEVRQGITDPRDYDDGHVANAPVSVTFDYLWFTPSAQTGNPCARFEAPSRADN